MLAGHLGRAVYAQHCKLCVQAEDNAGYGHWGAAKDAVQYFDKYCAMCYNRATDVKGRL
jgi:hypothetical protein